MLNMYFQIQEAKGYFFILMPCFAFKMISSRIKFISKLPLQVQKVELKFPSHDLLLSLDECAEQKSDNLQYDTLVYMADGTNNSLTKCLTLQVFTFIIHYRLRALKTLDFYFCNFIKKEQKKKIERVFAKNFERTYEKK